ncbi:MAG: radical SAM protein, partial [Sandaracinaceae bacterium]|nr:radical SAM protein [Sandaracinaceae bacterium]
AIHTADPSALARVPGLALPSPRSLARAFAPTPSRPTRASRDAIVSPYQRGLVRRGGIAYLQRFYGCPLTCTYCEWGAGDDAKNVCSTDYLVRELEAFGELECTGAMIVDAGLNMNARAFDNLRDAEHKVRFLRGKPLFAEVYPSQIAPETLDFLAEIGDAHVGVGLQSYDPQVLQRLDRSFDPARFERVVRDLASVCSVSIEIILALPGDHPSSFRRTLERARELPASVRVYPCVVLPTGLMTRAPAHFDLRFDPRTFKIDSCRGWSADALAGTSEWLTSLAREGGVAFDYWWGYPGPEHRGPVRASA